MKGMPKRNIVIDTNCLEDVRKSSLLNSIFDLPYAYQIPDAVFKKELSEFSEEQRTMVLRQGLRLIDLPGNLMQHALRITQSNPKLTIYDDMGCFLANSQPGCLLLAGERRLREFAETCSIEVHGTLWLIAELSRYDICSNTNLCRAIRNLDSIDLPSYERNQQYYSEVLRERRHRSIILSSQTEISNPIPALAPNHRIGGQTLPYDSFPLLAILNQLRHHVSLANGSDRFRPSARLWLVRFFGSTGSPAIRRGQVSGDTRRPRPSLSIVLAEFQLRDRLAVDFIRTVREPQGPLAGPCAGQEGVLADALGAVGLDRAV